MKIQKALLAVIIGSALAFGFGLTRVSAQVRMKKTPSQKKFTLLFGV